MGNKEGKEGVPRVREREGEGGPEEKQQQREGR